MFEQQFPGYHILKSIIYPQDNYGNPVYNPSGKYHVRLFYNGIGRLIEIDDRLPCINGNSNKPLFICSTTNPESFGISLIEKAYLKVYIIIIIILDLWRL